MQHTEDNAAVTTSFSSPATVSSPRVSVVIPTYNREESIRGALDSVLSQSFSDLEVIVVDDASTDATRDVVRSYDDSRVTLLVHETNLYAGAARNTGMEQAKGEFIAFLDSDDHWRADKLAKQIALFESDDKLQFTCTGLRMKAGRGLREKDLLPRVQRANQIIRYMTGKSFVITSTVMIRRNLLETVGLMDTRLRRNQDIDFFLRIMAQHPVRSIEEPLVDFFPNPGRPSAETIAKSNKLLLEKNKSLLAAAGPFGFRRVHSYFKLRHGQRLLTDGQFTSGLQAISSALIEWPFQSPRQYAAAAFRLAKGAVGSIRSR